MIKKLLNWILGKEKITLPKIYFRIFGALCLLFGFIFGFYFGAKKIFPKILALIQTSIQIDSDADFQKGELIDVEIQGTDSSAKISLKEPSPPWFDTNFFYRRKISITNNAGEEIKNYPIDLNIFWGGVPKVEEGSFSVDGNTYRYRTKVILKENSGQDLSDYQFEITLNTKYLIDQGYMSETGSEIRITDSDGTTLLPFWIEKDFLSASSEKEIYIYYDANVSASSLSDPLSVLESGGLWLTQWIDNHSTHPEDEEEMNELFSKVLYSSRDGWGKRDQIDCSSSCNVYGSDEKYLTLLEGWVYCPEEGYYIFATDSDDASDIFLDVENWKDNLGGVRVVNWYGGHGLANDWSHQGKIYLKAGFHRFVYRHEEVTGDDAWKAGWKKPSDVVIDYIPSTNFYYRKHTVPEPTVIVERSYNTDDISFSGKTIWLGNHPKVEEGPFSVDGNTYRYRTKIILKENSGQDLNGYHFHFLFNTKYLIDQGYMSETGSEIRITDSDGTTLLPFWIEKDFIFIMTQM